MAETMQPPKEPKKLAVLISGGGSNLQAIIDAVETGKMNATIQIVVSSNGTAFGLERAKKHGIKTAVACLKDFSSMQQRDKFIVDSLAPLNIDYVVLAGYLGILTTDFIASYKNRIVNIHPSLLPKFGGAGMHGLNVHKAVIEAGDPFSGATVHLVDDGIDTGKILAQKMLRVLPTDTPESLQKRIIEEIEHKLLVQTLGLLCIDLIKT